MKGKAWWFGAAEYRNQDAVAQVGTRDLAARTIRRGFAPAPLRRLPGHRRASTCRRPPNDDARASATRSRTRRTPGRARSTAPSARPASARRATTATTWASPAGRARSRPDRGQHAARRATATTTTRSTRWRPGRQLTFPSLQDGASFRVPQGTTQRRLQVTDALSLVRGRHALQGRRRGLAHRGRLRPGRLPRGPRRAGAGLPRVRPQPRRPRGRQRPAVRGHAAQRQARPGPRCSTTARSTYLAGFVQDDWRVTPQLTLNLGLRYELDTDVKNISGYGDINPIVQPFLAGRPQARPRQLRPARRLRLDERGGRAAGPRRLRHLLRPRDARDHLARARARRPRAAHRGARRQRASSSIPTRARCRRSRPPSRTRSPASSCPAPAPPASTSSTTAWRTRPCSSSTWARRRALPGRRGAAARPRAQPGHALHHRPPGRRGLQPGGGRAGPRGEPRVERQHASTTRCWPRLEKRLGARAAAAPVLHAVARPQLRERRPDPVRRRAHRPERPLEASTARRRTSSAIGWCSRARSSCPGELRLSPHLDDRLRRAHGHPDARRLEPRADAAAQRGRPAIPDRRRAQRLHHARSTPRAGSTACRCRSCPTTRASTTASTRSTCGCRARSRCPAAPASRRSSSASTSST